MTATPTEAHLPALRRAARTVVVVDVVESVRLIEQDEEGTVRRWQAFVADVVNRLLPEHGGRLVKSLGDGLMVEFEAVPRAVDCAIEMQRAIALLNSGIPVSKQVALRIGIHAADVIVDALDIYGSGVNLAARIASLAGPGEIVVSSQVKDHIVAGLDADVEDLGECYLKHLDKAVRAYRVGAPGPAPVIASRAATFELRPTIAVVPFDALSAGQAEAGLGDILADDLTSALSRSPHWNVVSRLSCAAVAGRRGTPADLRVQLGAGYVLCGTYRAHATGVRLNIELCDTRDQRIVWSASSTVALDALFAGDDTFLANVVSGVSAAVLSKELSHSGAFALPSLEGYSILLRGINLMHRMTRSQASLASEALQYLIERHPRSPEPRAWLAKWHVMKVAQAWTDDPVSEAVRARSTVMRALDLAPDHSLALAIDGLIYAFIERDLAAAQQRYGQALAANPNESLAWLFQSSVHAHRAEGNEAEACIEKALALSPLDPLAYYFDGFAAWAALSSGSYERAEQLARRSLRANCTHLPTYLALAMAQSLAGHAEQARDTAARLLELQPAFSVDRYVDRFPGGASAHARRLGDSLRAAGLPA